MTTDNTEATQGAQKERRIAMSIFLDESLVKWIEAQAEANKRARCREVEVLLEDCRRRAGSEVSA